MDKVQEYLNLMLDKALDSGDGDMAASIATLKQLIEEKLTDKE